MPVLDGVSLLREIRADSRLRTLPVILLSARAGEDARVDGFGAGADDYLTKPFAARELVARVRANLSISQIRGQLLDEVFAEKAKLAMVLGSVPAAVWFTFDADARSAVGNRYAAEMLGLSETDNLSLPAVVAESRGRLRILRAGCEVGNDDLPMQRAARGIEVNEEEIELHFADGSSRTLLMQARPLRNSTGAQIGSVSVGIDITERKIAERRQELLVNELNHRVKNTLATVQSIVSQTARGGAETITESLTSRLLSLSRVHDLLTRGNWGGTELPDLAAETLAPYAHEARLSIDGPKVRCRQRRGDAEHGAQ